MPNTCLFTAEVLTPETKDEHVILEKLGGRLISKTVTSSAFNNKSSDIDGFFLSAYGLLLRRLGPLFASAHKSGDISITIPGHENRNIYMNGEGGIYMRGYSVIDRDDDSIPSIYIGDDLGQMLRAIKRSGKNTDDVTVSTAALTRAMEGSLSGPILEPRLEICALKCTLLAFDYMLQKAKMENFTRHPLLAEARGMVCDFVMTGKLDVRELSKISLGIQYNKIDLYRQLRTERVKLPHQEFEHLMIACGNPYNGTLDVVWSLLGVDPYGFRLTNRWNGEPFTLIFASGSLKGAATSDLYQLAQSVYLCEPTKNRFMPGEASEEDMMIAASVISGQRASAETDSVVLVERQGPDTLLAERLCEAAKVDPGEDRRIVTAIRRRLIDKLYPDSATTEHDAPRLQEIIDQAMSSLSEEERQRLAPEVFVPEDLESFWSRFIVAYRSAFEDVLKEFGRPQIRFSNKIVIGQPGTLTL